MTAWPAWKPLNEFFHLQWVRCGWSRHLRSRFCSDATTSTSGACCVSPRGSVFVRLRLRIDGIDIDADDPRVSHAGTAEIRYLKQSNNVFVDLYAGEEDVEDEDSWWATWSRTRRFDECLVNKMWLIYDRWPAARAGASDKVAPRVLFRCQ